MRPTRANEPGRTDIGRRGCVELEVGENGGLVGETIVEASEEVERLRSRATLDKPVIERESRGRSFFGMAEVVNRSIVGNSPGGNIGTVFEPGSSPWVNRPRLVAELGCCLWMPLSSIMR